MQFIKYYDSPIGTILLTADECGLTGLLLQGEDWPEVSESSEASSPVLEETSRWLDIYFSGNIPDFTPDLNPEGTNFQHEVWNILRKIPYGTTTTYGSIAGQIAEIRGIKRMSAQAVGGAVGSNPISIIVPCHRVIGSDGSLTGFASGLDNKIALLKTEGISVD